MSNCSKEKHRVGAYTGLKIKVVEDALSSFKELSNFVKQIQEENRILKQQLCENSPFTLISDPPKVIESDIRQINLPVAFSVTAELKDRIHYVIKVEDRDGNSQTVSFDYHVLLDKKYNTYDKFMQFWIAVGRSLYENTYKSKDIEKGDCP